LSSLPRSGDFCSSRENSVPAEAVASAPTIAAKKIEITKFIFDQLVPIRRRAKSTAVQIV